MHKTRVKSLTIMFKLPVDVKARSNTIPTGWSLNAAY